MGADVKSFAVQPTENLDRQVERLAGFMAYGGCKIRVMPDAHPGKGAVVGSTIAFRDRVVPDTVGVDIGCRVSVFKLNGEPDMERLDAAVRSAVPSGFSVRDRECRDSSSFPYENLACWRSMGEDDRRRARLSMGSMGGGNHFIAVERNDSSGEFWLAVHCGSRSLGLKCAGYHQGVAADFMRRMRDDAVESGERAVRAMRLAGDVAAIQRELRSARDGVGSIDAEMDMAYLEGDALADYLNDMELLTLWTSLNHMNIFKNVRDAYGSELALGGADHVTCQHNYVDVPGRMIRKGAISAKEGELGLIPLNMRDGMLVVRGKGSDDWNQSLPHGAGRTMSRSEAFSSLSMEEYVGSMSGVWSSTVNDATLDESPMAYKPWEAIAEAIRPNACILAHLREVYNFKDDTGKPVRRRK